MSFRVTRRAFLAGVGAASAGLALGIERVVIAGEPAAKPLSPNPFVQIGLDGVVTVFCHRSEMGQGIRSSLPVLIADELGADPAKVVIAQGDGDAAYGDQNTDGSGSIRGPWELVRKAAATARTMLVTAAAQQWKVPAKSLVAHDDAVWNGTTKLAFAELVAAASRLPVPKNVTLRPIGELTHVGTELPLRDGADIVTGRAVYAADVRLPNMLTAMVARPPVLFGKVAKLDPARSKAVPGVRRVIELPAPKPPILFQALGGVAVLADTTWAAARGRAARDVTWNHGAHASHDTAKYAADLLAAVRTKGVAFRTVGDVETALAKAPTKLEAEYTAPYLAQSPMEPPAAIAKVDGKRCEVWACTQNPQGMQDAIAAALKLKKQDVVVHVTLLGGGFGRKSFPDFGVEAALLASRAGVPVRVQWTREDDLRHSTYHSISAQALAAGLDEHGKLVAWRHRIAYPTIESTFDAKKKRPADFEVGLGATDLPLSAKHVSVEVGEAPAHVRIGWLRSVCNIQQAFAIHSFIDELAHELKRDPRDMMLEVFGPARVLDAKSQGVKDLATNYGNDAKKTPYDVARLHGVIEKVSQMCKWDAAKKAGRPIGMAAHSSFASWVAVACEVSKGPHGGPRVERAWIAADCGIVVNPDRVRFQMEGAFVFAMSNAMHGKLTVKDGAVVEGNFHDYRLLRMPEAPRSIEVELVQSDKFPGGAGEPGVPPVAPAIANAWFALTGTRVRDLPFVGRS